MTLSSLANKEQPYLFFDTVPFCTFGVLLRTTSGEFRSAASWCQISVMCWVIFAQQESCSCDELHSKLAVKSRTSYLTQPNSFIKATTTKEPKSHLHIPCALLQNASRTKMKDQRARASVDPTASTSLPDTVKSTAGKITR